ncbi:MAG: type I-C CRISPR-associated protein Cas5c [Kiritimatiellae bacterium]|nr:type I-C CRISPR-associated protein Cas5c [Kiritimatiellia bacterium]
MSVYLRVWGDIGCFTRPEMKVERVSYPVITPSAARGVLEAILYMPQFRWEVQRIAVKRAIKFISFRRNEVKSKLPVRAAASWMRGAPPEPLFADEDRTQRNTLALRDVEYVIEAKMELTELVNRPQCKPRRADEPEGKNNIGKYLGWFERRASKGQCFAQPCLGCREFPAFFDFATKEDMIVSPGINANQDLGLMLYDVFDLDVMHPVGKVENTEAKITFFPASLKDGILTVPEWSLVKKQLGEPS